MSNRELEPGYIVWRIFHSGQFGQGLLLVTGACQDEYEKSGNRVSSSGALITQLSMFERLHVIAAHLMNHSEIKMRCMMRNASFEMVLGFVKIAGEHECRTKIPAQYRTNVSQLTHRQFQFLN